MFSREYLQEMGKEYETAIINREIDLFVSYIREGILKYANLGTRMIKFPLLAPSGHIQHEPNGTLNKYNPGPIPQSYVPEIIRKLKTIFPDTDFIPAEGMLYVNWA